MKRFFVMAIMAMTLGATVARSQNKATLPANQQDLCALAKLICPECKEMSDNTREPRHKQRFTKKKRPRRSTFKKITSQGVTIEDDDDDSPSMTYFTVRNPAGGTDTIGIRTDGDSISMAITKYGQQTSIHTTLLHSEMEDSTSDEDTTESPKLNTEPPAPPVFTTSTPPVEIVVTKKETIVPPPVDDCTNRVTRLTWQPIKQKQAFLRGNYLAEPANASPMVQMVCTLFKNNPDLQSLIFHTDGTIEAHGCISGSLSEQILIWCRVISTRG